MELTTTFARLKKAGACEDGYKKLARSLGGITKYGRDTPINLLQILDSNGVYDCLWALRAVNEECGALCRLMACDFAEQALPLFERDYPNDSRPRLAIETARKFANGQATVDELEAANAAAWAAARDAAMDAAMDAEWDAARVAARDAARVAAWVAARDAAMDAAMDAAWVAARDAAWVAAMDAAWVAARDAAWVAARDSQVEIIRRYLA